MYFGCRRLATYLNSHRVVSESDNQSYALSITQSFNYKTKVKHSYWKTFCF